MRAFYCIWTLILLVATHASAQQPEPAGTTTGYALFVAGKSVGREVVTVRSDAAGTVILSQGRLGPPFNSVLRRAEIRYRADGSAELFEVDANTAGRDVALRTTLADGTASTQGTEAGKPISFTRPVAPDVVILPSGVFGAMTMLARRLAGATEGAEIKSFIAPSAEAAVRVAAVSSSQMQSGTTVFDVRRYSLVLGSADPNNGALEFELTTAADGSLIRVSVPSQSLDVVRDDIAASTSRTQVFSNPGDEAVIIPAVGFNLGATLTRPQKPTPGQRLPAVILIGDAAAADRDGVLSGVPTLGQLAGALADAGFLAVRYDKRGFGQSGGRSESAGLGDYADDARVVAKWLNDRKDVDNKRIAIVGHGEGAWVALLAAARDKRFAAVVSLAGSSNTGGELLLEQQRHAFDQQKTPDAERAAKTAMQQRIHAAVISGRGWEGVPAEMRRQADTPWFHSIVTFNPAKVVEDIRQPLLIVHGALDKQVAVTHADRLAEIARTAGKSKAVEVVIVRGVNHLLTPATTGDVSEYATLPDRAVSADVATAVTGWLTKTLPAAPR
jgi:pimeloyl-ACP methyl ester carboxylesterase